MIRTSGRVLSGEGALEMPTFNAPSRNVNSIDLKIFPTHGEIYKFGRKLNKCSGKKDKVLRSL